MELDKGYLKEILFGLGIIIGFYILALIFWEPLLEFLKGVPVISGLIKLVLMEVERRSVLGISLMTFIGGLFFVAYPPEVLFFSL